LAPFPPEKAQFDLSVNEFIGIIGPLKSKFTNDLVTKYLIQDVLRSFGCDLNKTYFDVPRLRIVPADGYLSSGVSYAYKAHRDTWYSSPLAQINWWMPVFAIVPERAMSFYPEYWNKNISNSSSCFDYEEWCAVGRQQAATQVNEDARKHPLPLETVSDVSELRIAASMGDLTLFSAAHLHATVPNNSGLTRFSIDFRTVFEDDLLKGNGAPDVDNASTGTTLIDYLRASDLSAINKSFLGN
jgi:hypothetical protein